MENSELDSGGRSRQLDPDRVTWIVATSAFIIALILYSTTMCRTVFWWDSGEFIANASVLGIPHRPGFPLYILIARVFGLPPLGDFFYRINFLSAFCGAATVGTITFFYVRLLLRRGLYKRPAVYGGLLAVAAFMLTYSFWIQAVRAEVYTLNALIIAVLIALFERADALVKANPRYANRILYAAVFVFGLGLGGHHATLASVGPALLVLAIVIFRRRILRPGFLITALLLFIAGFSVYLYLPIRAAQSPILNWGWTTGSMVDGAQSVMATDAYEYIAKVTPGAVASKLLLIANLMIDQIGLPLAILGVIGLIRWFFRAARWASFFVIMALGNMLLTAVLSTEFISWNADLHGYLLPAFMAISFGMAVGFLCILGSVFRLLDRLINSSHLRLAAKTSLAGISVVLATTPMALGGVFCNLSDNRLAHDLGWEAISGLPEGSVVVMEGVNWSFVLRGLQIAGELRPDVILISRPLMSAEWYQRQCRQRYPELFAEVDFPDEEKALTTITWADEIRATGRPVYWEYTERELPYFRRFQPAGHLYRLALPDSALSDSAILQQEHFERTSLFYGAVDQIKYDFDAQGVYIRNLYRAGLYYEKWGLIFRAREMYRRALAIKPEEGVIRAALFRLEKVHQLTVDDPLP